MRKPCLLFVGTCIAGPPTVRGQILGSAGTANAGRASPAPTMKSRNSAYNYTRTFGPIVGVGLCSTRKALQDRRALAGEQCSPPTIESQKSDIFLRKPCLFLVEACIAGPPTVRSAFNTPAAHQSGQKHFPIAKKDPQVYRLQVLFSGAPSAGAFRKQCSALFLATGPRELNASCAAAQREAAP